jgi:asparagine synthase (glutamine-hydrolysing)
MCGIAGGFGAAAPDEFTLKDSLNLIRHRGPDDLKVLTSVELSLGTCRLAITEENDGTQPIFDSESGIYVAFNGEIYNYRELRSFLINKGVVSELKSEAQIILKLFQIFGVDFVKELEGMFAIAIFESKVKRVHLFRDRFGEKPLWYRQIGKQTLLFASEVRALRNLNPNLDFRPESISEVLQFGYVQPGKSTYDEIRSLPPATHLEWSAAECVTKTYWEPNFLEASNFSYTTAVEIAHSLIKDSVKKTLNSKRSFGAFLSGGVDSTLVAAMMSSELGNELQTFTIGFRETDFDESFFARQVAEKLSSKHYEIMVNVDGGFIESEIANVLDQPLADSSLVPSFLLAKFASNHVKVCLGGDGGDEVFGGYSKYSLTPMLQKMGPVLNLMRHTLPLVESRIVGKRKVNRNSKHFSSNILPSRRYLMFNTNASLEELQKVMNDNLPISNMSSIFESYYDTDKLENLNRMIRQDLLFSLPGALLYKADIASMANSLELRSPLLDYKLFEFASKLPSSFKVRGLRTKRILKDIAKLYIPQSIIERPKMGFLPPKASWLRNELRELTFDLLTDQTARQRGWFNNSQVASLLHNHMEGRDEDRLLWPILIMELWARKWL